MIRNYFKIAWINLRKNRFFSFINILGLTIGIASFLLMALYIFDELTFDRFHKRMTTIYKVVNDKTSPEGKLTRIAGAGYRISESAKADLPEIRDAVRLVTFGRTNVSAAGNDHVFYEDFTIGNEGFLNVFDFPLLHGDKATALTAPYSVIVTEETALKLFNLTNAVGMAIKTDSDSLPYRITGVLKNFPANSSISFNLLFSESSITNDSFRQFIRSDWESDVFTTYLLLDDQADALKTGEKINQLVAGNVSNTSKDKNHFTLQPLKDVHFYSADIEGGSGKKGNIAYIYVFSVVAFFVLFIACINYMNLTTARFTNRAKEIAMRKVAGASRQNLAGQFLSEAFLMTAIALVFALVITKAALPWFNAFTEKQLTLGTGTDYRILVGIGLTAVLVGLLSGLYPSLFQSGQKPLSLLKNRIRLGRGEVSLRRSLVILQFAVSIAMIVATMVVYLQMKYVNTKDVGFSKDRLLVVDINSGKVRRSWETIRNEFAKLSQVTDVSVSSRVPGEWKNLPKVKVTGANTASPEGQDMFFLGVDDLFLQTYQVTLVKGRNFLADGYADSLSVLINESAARVLGITDPSEQVIEIPHVNFGRNFSPLTIPFTVRVVGIVRDFNFQSLYEPLAPMVLAFHNNPIHSIDYFTARLSAGDTPATLKQMEEVLGSIDQSHLFEHHFLDKQWELFYRDDKIRETVFLLMATLAICIACLGLLGLATYAAEQRVKEIGIRKVLGASAGSIVQILSSDFVKPVLMALLVATPIAWWSMNKWLEDFAYRIEIQWWMFALAGLAAVVIALLTVSFQAIKAAVANPVESLRDE